MDDGRLPRTPSFRLDGKTAFVAGASRGIGQACAVALAEAGAHVILAARSRGPLEATVAALRAEDMSAEAVTLDAGDPDAVETVISGLARLDVMVNSVGMARHGPALEAEMSDVDAVLAANTGAAFRLAQVAARRMVPAGAGSIITISSQMGLVGGQDRSAYAASKHAIEGMTKSMAIEFGPYGVRINTICPTFIRTELTEATFSDPAKRAWIDAGIKLGRIGRVEDVMGPVVFLASDASAMMTGTHVLVDGGWTAA